MMKATEIKVFHRTSRKAAELINKEGLRRGSYVTLERISSTKCLELLEIPPIKCACLCGAKIVTRELQVPIEGPKTSGGVRQFQVTAHIPPDRVTCTCPKEVH